jgi:hypothetical protein
MVINKGVVPGNGRGGGQAAVRGSARLILASERGRLRHAPRQQWTPVKPLGEPLNLLDPYLYVSDPHPVYKRLRDEAPVYWDPVNRIWGISRYGDVLSIERDTTRYSSARGSRPLIEMSASMINRDDPRHLRQRKLVSGRFSPRAVRQHIERLRTIAAGRVATVAAKGTVDVVRDSPRHCRRWSLLSCWDSTASYGRNAWSGRSGR